MRTILATVVVLLAGCQSAARVTDFSGFPIGECPQAKGSSQAVTLYQLVSEPSTFEGALIRTSGYYYSGFEHSALYPEPGLDGQDAHAGIWVFGIDHALSGKHVQISGVYTSSIKGHLSMWVGSVCAVSAKELPPNAP